MRQVEGPEDDQKQNCCEEREDNEPRAVNAIAFGSGADGYPPDGRKPERDPCIGFDFLARPIGVATQETEEEPDEEASQSEFDRR